MGTVIAINHSSNKGTIKIPVDEGVFIENFGLEDDAHAGKWHRQVSLLGQESIDIMESQAQKGLCAGNFAENITTQGIVLYALPVGTRLRIGDTIQEVTQIGKECHTGCEIAKMVGSCIMPTQGIFCRVIKGGIIKKGDAIIIMEVQDV